MRSKKEDIYSSRAYSAGYRVTAVSTHPVGIDMEFVRSRVCEGELARTVATKREYTVLYSRAHTQNICALMTGAWVIKEAARKVLHNPRPYHPRELSIESCDDTLCIVYDKKNNARMRVLMAHKNGAYVAIAEKHTRALPFESIVLSIA